MDIELAERLARVGNRSTLILTHYGRKSGTPYRVTIWFLVDGDRVLLVTANVNRQWVRNVLARPKIELAIGDESFSATVRPITDRAERERAWELVRAKYWIAIPYLLIMRAMIAMGLVTDRTGAFAAALSGASAAS